MIRNLGKVALALLLLACLMGADKSCEQPDRNKPKPKATTSAGAPVKRTVEIRANSTRPYSVMLVVKDPDSGALHRRVGPELVAGGEYLQTVEYNSGEVWGIYLVVWGNAADTMECSITDGPRVDRPKPRLKETMCLLLTSQ